MIYRALTRSSPSDIILLRLRIREAFSACTGFDGGFEVEEAICGAGPRNNPYLKIKRKQKFSVRCLVVAVGLRSLTA